MNDVLLNIFFAYSRKDDDLRKRLDIHLSSLKRQKFINTWYDGLILPGSGWEKEIDTALSKADIILLLISADFIASDYCYEIEMRKAIRRHNSKDAVIIPIILHPCDWSDLPFAEIQALPQNGKAISSEFWSNKERAFSEVAKAIKNLVESLRKSKKNELDSIEKVLNEKYEEESLYIQEIEELQLQKEILNEEISEFKSEKKDLELNIKKLGEEKELYIEEIQNLKQQFDKMNKAYLPELNKLRKSKTELETQTCKLVQRVEALEKKEERLRSTIRKNLK